MSETGLDLRSLVIICSIFAFVLLVQRAEQRRNERRERVREAIDTLVAEVIR